MQLVAGVTSMYESLDSISGHTQTKKHSSMLKNIKMGG